MENSHIMVNKPQTMKVVNRSSAGQAFEREASNINTTFPPSASDLEVRQN